MLHCRAKLGRGPDPAPKWVGSIIAWVLTQIGPKGLEFGRYSIEYHYIRNFLHVQREWGSARASAHMPEFAKRIVARYNRDGAVTSRYIDDRDRLHIGRTWTCVAYELVN